MMKIMLYKAITSFIDSISLRVKIIIIFFTFIIMPLGAFTFIGYNNINSLIMKQVLNLASQSFEESTNILNKYFDQMNNAMLNLTYDRDIYDVATNSYSDYSSVTHLKDCNILSKKFNYLQKGNDIDKIHISIPDKFYYSCSKANTSGTGTAVDKKIYELLLDSGENRSWYPPFNVDEMDDGEQACFIYAGMIYGLNNLTKPLAVLRVDILSEKIETALNKAAITQNSILYIADSKGMVINCSQDNTAANFRYAKKLNSEKLQFDSWKQYQIDGREYFIMTKSVTLPGWQIISVIPGDDITALQNRMKNKMLLVLILIASISYFLAYMISNSSLRRLYLLSREMKKIEGGSLEVSLKQTGSDEIGELMGSFNKMVVRLSEMVNEKYKMGLEMKNAELRALQAQINPHFLYNSLDMINCSAIKHNIPEITQMITSLSKYYKLSLSQGSDIISIKDEMMHVQHYVHIQNLRFEHKIKLIINIEDEVYNYATLKTILQPIVENSILHGIFEKNEKKGTITISAWLENDLIMLKVEDDGVGMPEDKVRQILEGEGPDCRHGYGVKNIIERIKLYYGNEYGLMYKSELGHGTIAEIWFPAKEYENDDGKQ